MKDKKSKWGTDEMRIVLQTFNSDTSMAELCRQHNLQPRTVYTWKEKFLDAGKSSFDGSNMSSLVKRHKKEISSLKRIIGEYAVANDALKNVGGKQRMSAVSLMQEIVGLNKSLPLCGVSKKRSYGILRMAAQASRVLGRPVNHKAVSRIFKKLGWNEPARTKKEIIRSNIKPPRPDAPNKFWKSDMAYIWCVDCRCGSLENQVDMDFCLKIHNTPQNEMIFVSGFWQLVFVTNPNYHQPHFLENQLPANF